MSIVKISRRSEMTKAEFNHIIKNNLTIPLGKKFPKEVEKKIKEPTLFSRLWNNVRDFFGLNNRTGLDITA